MGGPIHKLGGYAGRGRRTYIPARPFLTIANEDLRELDEVILSYYSTRFV